MAKRGIIQPKRTERISRNVPADIKKKRVKAALAAQQARGLKLGARADGGKKVFWDDDERANLVATAVFLVKHDRGAVGRRTSLRLLRDAQEEAIQHGLLGADRRRRMMTLANDTWFEEGWKSGEKQYPGVKTVLASEQTEAATESVRSQSGVDIDRVHKPEAAEPIVKPVAPVQPVAQSVQQQMFGDATRQSHEPSIHEVGYSPKRDLEQQAEEELLSRPQRAEEHLLSPRLRRIIAMAVNEVFEVIEDTIEARRQTNARAFMTAPAERAGPTRVAPASPPPRPSVSDLRPPASTEGLSPRDEFIRKNVLLGIPQDVAERLWLARSQPDAEKREHEDDERQPESHEAQPAEHEAHEPNGNIADPDHHDDDDDESPPPPSQLRPKHNPEMLSTPRAKQPIVVVIGLSGVQQEKVKFAYDDVVVLKFWRHGEKLDGRIMRIVETADLVISTGFIGQLPLKMIREAAGKRFRKLEGGQLVEGVKKEMNSFLATPNLEDVIAGNRAVLMGKNGHGAAAHH